MPRVMTFINARVTIDQGSFAGRVGTVMHVDGSREDGALATVLFDDDDDDDTAACVAPTAYLTVLCHPPPATPLGTGAASSMSPASGSSTQPRNAATAFFRPVTTAKRRREEDCELRRLYTLQRASADGLEWSGEDSSKSSGSSGSRWDRSAAKKEEEEDASSSKSSGLDRRPLLSEQDGEESVGQSSMHQDPGVSPDPESQADREEVEDEVGA